MTLEWVLESIHACKGRGSSHSYAPILGWNKAYPETTGYLIETLLDYADLMQRPDLDQAAMSCADWLEDIQLPNGAFSGGLVGSQQPSVFNTGQILFGLARTDRKAALQRAVTWLLEVRNKSGGWLEGAYVEGYEPTYYTRVVWGILKANEVLKSPEIDDLMRISLRRYATRFQANNSIIDWGFRPNEPGFTHTIAYTLEGFFESALSLNETEILEKTLEAFDFLLEISQKKGGTAGAYDLDWKGNHRFRCVTGNAQLSILAQRAFAHTGHPKYREAARRFLSEIEGAAPCTFPMKGLRGAIPGSIPIWGDYARFRYPNWAAKFYLDAVKSEVAVVL